MIRQGYGDKSHYVPLVGRSLELWRELESERGTQVFDPRGVLWLVTDDGAFEQASLAGMEKHDVRYRTLTASEVAAAYPAIRCDDVAWAVLELDAGALYARRGCELVWESVKAHGGSVQIAAASGFYLRQK